MIVAGPLADNVFGPLLEKGGSLAGSLGPILGVGPGRGIGLFFVVLGLMSIGFTIIAYSYPRLRNLEDEVPDVEAPEATVAADASPVARHPVESMAESA